MLAESPDVAYIHEPFNIDHDPGICTARFDLWYTYVTERNAAPYFAPLSRTLELKYDVGEALRAARSPRALARTLRRYGSSLKNRRLRPRPLMKDPIALLSAPWLVSTFAMTPIVLIRHPAAFVASLKRLDWTFPFSHFVDQPLLMEDRLKRFAEEIETFARSERDVVDQASLLWTILHDVIDTYRQAHPDWRFVRHEDLSRDPVEGFRALFADLGLQFSQRIQAVVRLHSDSSNPAGDAAPTYSIRRDSRGNVLAWKKLLDAKEIGRIRARVEEISSRYYSEKDW